MIRIPFTILEKLIRPSVIWKCNLRISSKNSLIIRGTGKEDKGGAIRVIKVGKDGEARVVRVGEIKEAKEDGVTKAVGEIQVISLKEDSEAIMGKEALVVIKEEIQTITITPTITHRIHTRAHPISIIMVLTSMFPTKSQNLLLKISQNNLRIPSTT